MSKKTRINPSEFDLLIVDDEDAIRNFLEEITTEWGFNVKTANDGEVALKMIQQGELPHVILTDINMPGLSGISLAKRAKEISDEIEVVIMTANASLDSAVEAIKLGVHDYLMKPFEDLEDVRRVLLHVCERIYLKMYNEFLVQELTAKNNEITSLAKMSEELADVLEVAQTIRVGCRYMSSALKEAPIIFFQFVAPESAFTATARTPEDLLAMAQPKFFLAPEYLGSIENINNFLKSLDQNEKLKEFLIQTESLDHEKKLPADGKWVFFPFITRGIPRGFFASKTNQWNQETDEASLKRYVLSLEKFFENALLHHKTQETATKDGLTGLYNVRYFRERMEREIKLSTRLQHPMSLIFFDVDHFKKYNDTHGHPAGDVVLKTVADLMRRKFRGTDLLVRYGGEEFCILMPHTCLADALQKAEKFREAIETHKFPNEETQPLKKVTISIGVSEFPTHASTSKDLVQAADDALYEAKKTSRNLVVQAKQKDGYVSLFQSKHVQSDHK